MNGNDSQRDIEQLAARLLTKKSFIVIINMTYSCRVGFAMIHMERERNEDRQTDRDTIHIAAGRERCREVAPEKLKTVIRHPIKTKGD